MLHLTLVGNLGADPEVGTTEKGTPVATMRVAVNKFRTDRTTDERLESTDWFRVRAMGRLVDQTQHLTKGTRVLVIGRLDIGHYQTSEGEPRVSFDVWADNIAWASPRTTARTTGSGRTETAPNRPPAPQQPPRGGVQSSSRSQSTSVSRPHDDRAEDLPW